MSALDRPYGLSPDFEAAVAFLASARPTFYGRVGHALDPSLMELSPAALAVKAAQAIAKDVGHGPGSTLLVLQRLNRWVGEGKVEARAVQAVSMLFDGAEELGLPDEEASIRELAQVLRRRAEKDAIQAAASDHAKGVDLTQAQKALDRARRIGEADESLGTIFGELSFQEIESLRQMQRLLTGIPMLDDVLDGGLPRGALGLVVAGTGEGKSQMLTHVAAKSMLSGLHVAYATLELPNGIVLARLKAALTGLSINSLLDGTGVPEARRILGSMTLGRFVTKFFPARATTVSDLTAWVARIEEGAGRMVDVLAVDYVDKLSTPAREKDSTYKTGEEVTEQLRLFHHGRGTWGWTASQARRKQKGKANEVKDADDVADSMGKSRVADLVVTANGRDDGESILWHVAKNRHGKSQVTVGPLPHEFWRGRVCAVPWGDDGDAP